MGKVSGIVWSARMVEKDEVELTILLYDDVSEKNDDCKLRIPLKFVADLLNTDRDDREARFPAKSPEFAETAKFLERFGDVLCEKSHLRMALEREEDKIEK